MTSATDFDVLADSTFMGNFAVGALCTFTQVEFTVSGTYTLGDSWTFHTYSSIAGAGNLHVIEVLEPSMISFDATYCNLVMAGGL
jgi:hypothetical protein